MTLDCGDYGIFLLILMGNAGFISYTVTPRFGNFLCLCRSSDGRGEWRLRGGRGAPEKKVVTLWQFRGQRFTDWSLVGAALWIFWVWDTYVDPNAYTE